MNLRAMLVPVLFAFACSGKEGSSSKPIELKNDEQKTLYAVGLMLGQNLSVFHLNEDELVIVKKGITDHVLNTKPQLQLSEWGPKIGGLARGRAQARAEAEKTKAKPYLEKAEKEPGAEKTPSGLVFRSLNAGSGESPTANDVVKVHYHGTLTDGTVFDSSVDRKQPSEFGLHGVIPCWTEALQKMKVGGKARIVCPSTIAYGDQGRPPTIPGGATLTFEIELLEIKKGAPAPPPTMGMGHGPPGGMHAPGGAPMVGRPMPPHPIGHPPPAPPAAHTPPAHKK